MSGSHHFVEPHVAARRTAREAMFYHRVPVLFQTLHAFCLLVRAAILRHPVSHGQRHGHVCAPAAFVFQVAAPLRSVVSRAMHLHDRYRTFCLELRIHPLHGKSGNRSHGFESFLLVIERHQVTHLASVRHASEKSIRAAQFVTLLHVLCYATQCFYVVLFPSCLRRITHVPAGFSFRVAQALRYADCKSVAFGSRNHRILAPNRTAVTM